jgi:hypothetical protein
VAVDGDLRRRRRRRGELARPTSMDGGSRSNSVLEEEATTASLFPGLDGEVEQWRDDAREKEMGDESLCWQL